MGRTYSVCSLCLSNNSGLNLIQLCLAKVKYNERLIANVVLVANSPCAGVLACGLIYITNLSLRAY